MIGRLKQRKHHAPEPFYLARIDALVTPGARRVAESSRSSGKHVTTPRNEKS
jgi:hypothetical protein